jgi:hypothetical protein
MVTLIDSSVWGWRGRSRAVSASIDDILRRREAATCHPVMLEVLYGVRNVTDFRALRSGFDVQIVLPIASREWSRALDVYEALAAQGGAHQRSVQHPDLLAAAAAESAGAEVLHYDEDFDRIAAITGQPTRWVAPRGSLG